MIISHSTLGKNGRLGNQLFQVASTLGLAEKHGTTAAFPQWEYERYFDISLPHGPMSSNVVQEKYFHYHDWEIAGDVDVMGFLQSEKYFGSTKLKLKEEFVQEVKSRVPGLFTHETVCIQVRRGDYVGNPNYHQLPITYYICALLEHFPNWRDMDILVISDDVEYCKVHFGCLPNVTFSEGNNTDIQDMALASLCDHFIISNSSFGWWCAWLGEKKHTKVVHSGHMFAGKLARKNANDYRPARWISYNRESYKIPLKDVTFTIPVYFDHPFRKENLDLICYLLLNSFETQLIVSEQGGNKFKYVESWATYMVHAGNVFHRTKMLNDMCNRAGTPYVANWDADVIVAPMQVLLAVEALRNGADMAYPYDGGFARMPRLEWFPKLQKSFDIGVVGNTFFKGRDPSENSSGGAVLWNKEAFIDAGMENEYMVSFGPEDGERLDRAKKLGYRVERIQGPLFHMNHHVGPNSSPKNPYFNANVIEQKKVFSMSASELRAYVDTWPWRHQYTNRYYREISEGAMRSARIVMEALPFQVGSVIDVGCGVGEWSNGNPDYIGIDYRIDKDKLLIPYGSYVECNLNREFVVPPKKFDLALCLEVAEHLHPSRAEPLVEYLCSLSDRVLFSAAIPYQGGSGHVNEQWQEWWAELFYKNGFGTTDNSVKLALTVVHHEEVELWYRQNMVLYERGGPGRVTNFVLPEYYEQIVKGAKDG
jgi:hypothetical protein